MTKFPVIILLAACCLSAGFAQGKPSSSTQKSDASNQTCDGALDIVPSKPMTFTRKRRPTTGVSKPLSKPAAKKQT